MRGSGLQVQSSSSLGTRLGNTPSAGLLVRLAFDDGGHLTLEQLDDISAEAVLSTVNVPEIGKISSLSLCVTSIRNLSNELVEGLSKLDGLREIYFLQSPSRQRDTLDWQLFQALYSRPQFLSRVNAMFAGSYSAALCKTFWLPTNPGKTINNTAQIAPLSIFPINIPYPYSLSSKSSSATKIAPTTP